MKGYKSKIFYHPGGTKIVPLHYFYNNFGIFGMRVVEYTHMLNFGYNYQNE